MAGSCLNLADAASSLPDLLAAGVAHTAFREHVDELLDRALPVEPQRDDYLVTVNPQYEGEFEDQRYRWDHQQWNADFIGDARTLLAELSQEISTGPTRRSPEPPTQSGRQRVPADLLTVEMLRTIADPNQYAHQLHHPYSPEQLADLQSTLQAVDPQITVPHPEDPEGPPVYEGSASNAHAWLVPGVYAATGTDGGAFRLVVGPAPAMSGGTAPAAFPTEQHDTHTLDRVAAVLENYRSEQTPADALQAVSDALTSTGRSGVRESQLQPHRTPSREHGAIDVDGTRRLEDGLLLSELLAQREMDLNAKDDRASGHQPDHGPEPHR